MNNLKQCACCGYPLDEAERSQMIEVNDKMWSEDLFALRNQAYTFQAAIDHVTESPGASLSGTGWAVVNNRWLGDTLIELERLRAEQQTRFLEDRYKIGIQWETDGVFALGYYTAYESFKNHEGSRTKAREAAVAQAIEHSRRHELGETP